ncbi:MAG: hypothetical protein SPF17_00385 [Candidatus Mucispirillum faecigallinarum]|nr:hypothetical protein [Candidatus Mucispirillum faecigallinarum]
MQQQEFELSIAKFFEKAGVKVIKKGQEYDDNINSPAYILLDTKRKAYYLTETDVQEISKDIETAVTKFADEVNMPVQAANAVFRIGRDISVNNNQFSINSQDLSALDCKSALVISDENSQAVKDYLTNNSYKFQAVPLKGQFLVIFFDKGMEDNLINLYKKYADNENKQEEDDDDITPVFTPKEESSVEDIDLYAPKKNNFDAETPIVAPKEEKTTENIQENKEEVKEDKPADNQADDNKNAESSPEDAAEDELLDSIDLSDLLKPAKEEDTPKDETEAELLYGKILNEQSGKIEVSNNGPVEKTLDEIPEGIISEEELKDMAEDNTEPAASNAPLDKKAAKLKEKEEKRQAKLAKKREKEAEKYTYENRNKPWLDVPGKIAANIIGIIFFLPVYILNKLNAVINNFFPPFVLYWFTAIIAIFGGYQFLFSLLPQPLSDVFLNKANDAISMMQNYKVEIPEGQNISDIASTSLTMMKNSAIAYYASLKGIDILMNNGYLLQYMLGFGAIMLIFPAFRFIGKTITIFSVLSYFLLPVVTYSQGFLIEKCMVLPEINLTAAAVQFIVYIYPLLLLFAVLYISSALVPDTNKRKEVLP